MWRRLRRSFRQTGTPRLVDDKAGSGVRPTAIFLVLGGLLLALAFAVKPHDFSGAELSSLAMLSAAFVFLTVAALNLLWGWLGGDPIMRAVDDLRGSMELFRDSQATGIQRILSVSGAWSYEEWMAKLRSATGRVDLMGFNLLAWHKGDNFENELLRLVKSGVKVRALIMDAGHPHLDGYLRSYPSGTGQAARIRARLEEAREIFEGISQQIAAAGNDAAGSFELRTVRKGKMTLHLCRIDAELVAVPYLFSASGSQAPLLLLRGRDSKLFRAFESEFDQLWDINAREASDSDHAPQVANAPSERTFTDHSDRRPPASPDPRLQPEMRGDGTILNLIAGSPGS